MEISKNSFNPFMYRAWEKYIPTQQADLLLKQIRVTNFDMHWIEKHVTNSSFNILFCKWMQSESDGIYQIDLHPETWKGQKATKEVGSSGGAHKYYIICICMGRTTVARYMVEQDGQDKTQKQTQITSLGTPIGLNQSARANQPSKLCDHHTTCPPRPTTVVHV